MAWKRDPSHLQFRDLNDDEERDFRTYARRNYEPDPTKRNKGAFIPDPSVHHPVIVDECAKMDLEWRRVLEQRQTLPPFGKEVK